MFHFEVLTESLDITYKLKKIKKIMMLLYIFFKATDLRGNRRMGQ